MAMLHASGGIVYLTVSPLPAAEAAAEVRVPNEHCDFMIMMPHELLLHGHSMRPCLLQVGAPALPKAGANRALGSA